MAKKQVKFSNPLSSTYNSLAVEEQRRIRAGIMTEAGISRPQFYYLLKHGRAKQLQRQVLSKWLQIPESELFPVNE